MVCIYCNEPTTVTNSRLQKRRNSVWRRRRCQACGAQFTSIERPDLDVSLGFEDATSHIVPFNRDALFLSMYEACKHRPQAVGEASELTDTVIRKLMSGHVHQGLVKRTSLVALTSETLGAFDTAAQVHYTAYHRL